MNKHEQNMFFGHRCTPSSSLIDTVCWEFKKRLFWSKNYCFILKHIVKLLNCISRSKFAPSETNGLLWDECILSIINVKN